MEKINDFDDLYNYLGTLDPKSRLKDNFQKFSSVLLRRLYYNSVNCGIDCIDENLFDVDLVGEYLNKVDSECIEDPEFSKVILGKKKELVKQLGSAYEKFTKDYNYSFMRGCVSFGVSYIPGLNSNDPNKLRLDICEEINKSKVFINGNIDILSNGKIKIGDFDEMIYSESPGKNGEKVYKSREFISDIRSTSIDMQALEEIKEFVMYLFEIADLKTEFKQKTKK